MAISNDPSGIFNHNPHSIRTVNYKDLQNMQSNYTNRRNRTLEELNSEEMSISMRLLEIQRERQQLIDYTPLSGPTPGQLKEYPALKSIWDELETTMKLCGIQNV